MCQMSFSSALLSSASCIPLLLHTMVSNLFKTALVALTAIASPATAFVAKGQTSRHVAIGQSNDAPALMATTADEHPPNTSQRRLFLQNLSTVMLTGGGAAVLSSLPGVANAEAETMERGGVSLTPFNSLSFNYRGALHPIMNNLFTICPVLT